MYIIRFFFYKHILYISIKLLLLHVFFFRGVDGFPKIGAIPTTTTDQHHPNRY